MNDRSLSVSELLTGLHEAVVAAYPGPVWVRGEVTGFRRTSGGAAFFRLADPDVDDASLDVAARGRVMAEVDRMLADAGLGSLRDGIGVRIRGTVGVEARRSTVRLTLLEVDPTFTAGRLALDRAALIAKMAADGSLETNKTRAIPLVPLRIGLVTSRGSAAHGDFIDQLRRSGYRFAVKTAHTSVQGDGAQERVAAALSRFTPDVVDVVALLRGGGSKLDLAVFDDEIVARAVSRVPVPVITGIGHDMDRSVADEAAAIVTKTPSAAGEWLVTRANDFAGRLETARHSIRSEAGNALRRHRQLLKNAASEIAGGATALRRQSDALARIGSDVAAASRDVLTRQRTMLHALGEWFSAVDVEPTLKRGFAILLKEDGKTVVKSADDVGPGERLLIRLADGTVRVTAEDK
ncbi:MAG: exodeoxyribonuclease VII large subunit [Acidimicrobiia bacterium]